MNRYDPGLNDSGNYYEYTQHELNQIEDLQSYDKYTAWGVLWFLVGVAMIVLPFLLPRACE